jgi:hypothetical protein
MSRSLTPQNPLSTNTISVSSANGFSAGDLVYQKSGDVGVIPDGLVTAANFNISTTAQPGALGPSTAQQITTTGGIGGGAGSGFPNAARLATTNNMVVVYCSLNTTQYYFRIIDENGTQVVAETLAFGGTGAGTANNGTVAVTALTGGGFAMACQNSSNQLTYAIYTNLGVLVGSVTSDSSVNINTSAYLNIASRPDGSFIIVINDTTSSQTRFKVYSSTGVQVIGWTNVIAYYTAYARCSVAVRSDNSFVISTYSTTTNIQYYVYSNLGAAVTNASVSSGITPNANYTRLDSTTLTNDSVVFILNEDSTQTVYFRILTAANSLGSLQSAGVTSYTSNVKSLSSGGFVIFNSQDSQNWSRYSVRNSAGTQTSAGNMFGLGMAGPQRGGNYSIVEMASNIAVITSGMYPASASVGNTGFQVMSQIVTATSAVRNFSTASIVTGSVSSSVNTYARSGSTPNAASFLASTNTTLTKSIARTTGSTYVLEPTVVANAYVTYVYTRVMQNGQIIVLYQENNTSAIRFAVYSPSGVLLNTYTVATTSYVAATTKCCVLTNGNLVIAYANNPSSSLSLALAIYSPSYVLLSTVTASTNAAVAVNAGFDISPMTNSRFALSFYAGGSTPTWQVYDSTATLLASGTQSTSYNICMAIAGTANGGFVTVLNQNGGSSLVTWFQNTSGVSFSSFATTTYGSSCTSMGSPSIAVTPSGAVYSFFVNSGSASLSYLVNLGASVGAASSYGSGSTNATQTIAGTVMPDGSIVNIFLDTVNGYAWKQIAPSLSVATGTIAAIDSATISFNTAFIPYGASSNPTVSIAALYDNQFVVAYRRQTDLYPVIFIGSTTAGSYSLTTVSGTTVSNPAYFPSQSNGYIFKGVATTTVPASGSGVVQNVGAAQLNSQYPSTTTYQAFDSTGTLIQGTKGTITGRNVNMTGTS